MAKRDYIAEIGDLQSRLHRRGERWMKASRRFTPLIETWSFLDKAQRIPKRVRGELRRYMPVAVIAGLEGYCRLVYADLINAGEPYRSNAKNLQLQNRFTVDAILGIGKTCTAGQLIAHLLPHKGVGDINTNLSTIIGTDFKSLIIEDESIVGDLRAEHPLSEFVDRTWRCTHEVFEARHIICHELATKRTFSRREIHRNTVFALGLVLIIESFCKQQLKRK